MAGGARDERRGYAETCASTRPYNCPLGAPRRFQLARPVYLCARRLLLEIEGSMIHRSVGVAFVGFVVAVVVGQPFARAGGSSNEADSLIRHGIELRKAHDDEGAAREFQKAYDQIHTPRAAGQLGLAEQALGRWEDAERHVGEALHAAGDAWVVKNRVILDEALGAIQGHLARIEVLGDPEGADVSVNGRGVGKLPLKEAVRVSAGEVEVELHASGYVPMQRTLTIVAGQYQRLVLHLTKEAPASA